MNPACVGWGRNEAAGLAAPSRVLSRRAEPPTSSRPAFPSAVAGADGAHPTRRRTDRVGATQGWTGKHSAEECSPSLCAAHTQTRETQTRDPHGGEAKRAGRGRGEGATLGTSVRKCAAFTTRCTTRCDICFTRAAGCKTRIAEAPTGYRQIHPGSGGQAVVCALVRCSSNVGACAVRGGGQG